MPKEKNYNPVQAQRKADKAREIRKGTLSEPKQCLCKNNLLTTFFLQERPKRKAVEMKS